MQEKKTGITGVGTIGIPAVLFMNTNKSESNIRKIVVGIRGICHTAGLDLKHEVIVHKGPARDIDREAINMLIALLLTGQYQVVVVEKMTEIIEDQSDLEEFMCDAANIGVGFFELATMEYRMHGERKLFHNNFMSVWDGGIGC